CILLRVVVELPEKRVLLSLLLEEELRPELRGESPGKGRLADADRPLHGDVPPRRPLGRHPLPLPARRLTSRVGCVHKKSPWRPPCSAAPRASSSWSACRGPSSTARRASSSPSTARAASSSSSATSARPPSSAGWWPTCTPPEPACHRSSRSTTRAGASTACP